MDIHVRPKTSLLSYPCWPELGKTRERYVRKKRSNHLDTRTSTSSDQNRLSILISTSSLTYNNTTARIQHSNTIQNKHCQRFISTLVNSTSSISFGTSLPRDSPVLGLAKLYLAALSHPSSNIIIAPSTTQNVDTFQITAFPNLQYIISFPIEEKSNVGHSNILPRPHCSGQALI